MAITSTSIYSMDSGIGLLEFRISLFFNQMTTYIFAVVINMH